MTGVLVNNGIMKVYHGSDTKITVIDLSKCEMHKDFGQGFYVTSNPEHAKTWAMVKADWRRTSPYVNEFEFMRSAFANKEYKTLQFSGYSPEWLEFVIKNRDISTNEKQHDFDIVEGPIADDKVQRQLKSYFAGRITKEGLLENLKYHVAFTSFNPDPERPFRHDSYSQRGICHFYPAYAEIVYFAVQGYAFV